MSSEAKETGVKSDKVISNEEDSKESTAANASLKSAALLPADVQPNDIVFGRGKGYHGHAGNERMRNIINKYKMQYHSIDRSQKRDLVEVVHDEIVQDGARFLVKASSGYEEADRTMALQKVSNALRCKKSFQREAALAGSPSGRRNDAKLSTENDSIARALASRPLHETLSSPIAGVGQGLTSLESLILANNHANRNLFIPSPLVPMNLATQTLRGDVLPRSASMGAAGAPSLSAALRSELATAREHEAAQRNLALGIPTSSSLPYASLPGQQSLDHIALLRQELLLNQLGLGRTRFNAASMASDLRNRLAIEELLSRAPQDTSAHGNAPENKSPENKNPQRKDPGL